MPIKAGTAKVAVALVVDSITPNTGLNQLGGDVLTFAGKGFDSDFTNTEIKFKDNSKCTITSATDKQLKCTVAGFDLKSLDLANPYKTTVTVNKKTNDAKTVALKSTKQDGVSVTPNSVNPILPTLVKVKLPNAYPGDMNGASDFTARLLKKGAENEPPRPLYVKSVDKAKKEVEIKFPGAMLGVYLIEIEGKGVGRIGKTSLELSAVSQVDSITPMTGSYLGGTLVTITGTNFSKEKTDNPVKVGSNWCDVLTTEATKITCRVRETKATKAGTGLTSVFLRTQEEMKYKDGFSKTFTFADPAQTVTSLTAAFDAATNT